MRLRARIRVRSEDAALIVNALMPDNINININTDTSIEGEGADGTVSTTYTYLEAPRIGTLIATLDDYLLNARVAQAMVKMVREEL